MENHWSIIHYSVLSCPVPGGRRARIVWTLYSSSTQGTHGGPVKYLPRQLATVGTIRSVVRRLSSAVGKGYKSYIRVSRAPELNRLLNGRSINHDSDGASICPPLCLIWVCL